MHSHKHCLQHCGGIRRSSNFAKSSLVSGIFHKRDVFLQTYCCSHSEIVGLFLLHAPSTSQVTGIRNALFDQSANRHCYGRVAAQRVWTDHTKKSQHVEVSGFARGHHQEVCIIIWEGDMLGGLIRTWRLSSIAKASLSLSFWNQESLV